MNATFRHMSTGQYLCQVTGPHCMIKTRTEGERNVTFRKLAPKLVKSLQSNLINGAMNSIFHIEI